MFRTRFLVGAAVALVTAADPASAQTTFNACRVPAVGVIYMVGVAGAPSACLDVSHVAFSWTEGGAPADGSITTPKLADGAVTTAKILDGTVSAADHAASSVNSGAILDGSVTSADILDNSLTADDFAAGAAGRMVTVNIGSASGIPTTATNLGSIAITAPAAGTVFVALVGYAVTFGDNTTVTVGLGTSSGAFDLNSVSVGVLDGVGTQRRYFAFNPMSVVSVNAGTTTLYASAQVPSVFSAQSVNLGNLRLVAIYQPL